MFASTVWLLSFVWLVGSTVCALLQPRRRRQRPAAPPDEAITVVVPTSAVDSPRSSRDRNETLTALLKLTYPRYEIIVCVDRTSGSAEVRRVIEAVFGSGTVRTTVAEHEISPNAKIDAMQTGLQQASNDLILFCDDDVWVDRRHLEHLFWQLTGNTKLVSAAAIGVQPKNLWGHLECSFMNGQFARLHLAGDLIGFSGALGKTVLIRRSQVEKAGGLLPAGTDCCEDAALTLIIKRARGKVVLSDLPVHQPIRDQRLFDVLRRHRRWLSCRRKYLPFLFIAEGLFSPAVAATAGALAVGEFGRQPLLGLLATVALWCLADCLFAASHRYLAPLTPLAWLIREIVFIPLWLSALFARTVTWYGRRVPA
jgi:ceramide glucosyltransferase